MIYLRLGPAWRGLPSALHESEYEASPALQGGFEGLSVKELGMRADQDVVAMNREAGVSVVELLIVVAIVLLSPGLQS